MNCIENWFSLFIVMKECFDFTIYENVCKTLFKLFFSFVCSNVHGMSQFRFKMLLTLLIYKVVKVEMKSKMLIGFPTHMLIIVLCVWHYLLLFRKSHQKSTSDDVNSKKKQNIYKTVVAFTIYEGLWKWIYYYCWWVLIV